MPPNSLRREGKAEMFEQEAQEAVSEWQDRMEKMLGLQHQAASNAGKAHDRQAKYFNERRRHVEYSTGVF